MFYKSSILRLIKLTTLKLSVFNGQSWDIIARNVKLAGLLLISGDPPLVATCGCGMTTRPLIGPSMKQFSSDWLAVQAASFNQYFTFSLVDTNRPSQYRTFKLNFLNSKYKVLKLKALYSIMSNNSF